MKYAITYEARKNYLRDTQSNSRSNEYPSVSTNGPNSEANKKSNTETTGQNVGSFARTIDVSNEERSKRSSVEGSLFNFHAMKREKITRDLRERVIGQVVAKVWPIRFIGGVDSVSSDLTIHFLRRMSGAAVERTRNQVKQIL